MIPLVSNEVVEAYQQDLLKQAAAHRRSRAVPRTPRFGMRRNWERHAH